MAAEQLSVIHVVNQMRPGGIETMVADLAILSKHYTRIISLEGTAPNLVGGWPALGPLADRLEALDRPPRLDPRLIVRLARRLREIRPSTVFLHRTNPLLYGGVAARLARVPTIVHVEHDVWQYRDPSRRRLLIAAAKIVRPLHFAVSGEIAATLAEMLPSHKIRVVPGGVDVARFGRTSRHDARKALNLAPDARVVGSVGRLEAVKGHRTLIQAVPYLPDDVLVLLVGQGSERERLQQLATQLGVAERVHFLGHRDDIDRIMPAFDIFCLPSLSEGLPRVVMEVQAAGVPVVASDVGAVRQAVDPDTGLVVPADHPLQLANALTDLIVRAPDGSSCRRFAESHFSIEGMVAAYDALTPYEVRGSRSLGAD